MEAGSVACYVRLQVLRYELLTWIVCSTTTSANLLVVKHEQPQNSCNVFPALSLPLVAASVQAAHQQGHRYGVAPADPHTDAHTYVHVGMHVSTYIRNVHWIHMYIHGHNPQKDKRAISHFCWAVYVCMYTYVCTVCRLYVWRYVLFLLRGALVQPTVLEGRGDWGSWPSHPTPWRSCRTAERQSWSTCWRLQTCTHRKSWWGTVCVCMLVSMNRSQWQSVIRLPHLLTSSLKTHIWVPRSCV